MDIYLSETQRMIRDSLRDYLQREVPFNRIRQLEREGGYDRILWGELQRAGWLGLPFPEDMGGQGGELTDLAVLLEELTRRAVIIPFMETMTAAVTIQRYGDPSQARPIIDGVVAGRTTIAPAVLEASDRLHDVRLEVVDGRLTGEKYFVDYGQLTTHHLVAARQDGEIALFLVDANSPAVKARPLRHIGRTPQAIITYEGAPVTRIAGNEGYRFLMQLAPALTCIQCLGACQQALDMTVEYVSMRVQFGRPIGTFQAVQHHCANMATMVEALRFLSYEAVWAVDRGLATDKQIAVAKAWAGKTTPEVTMLAHHLHGGIGFVEEYDLHFFSTQGKARALAWGSAEESLATIASSIEEAEQWL